MNRHEKNLKHILIHGKSGSGKTTYLNKLINLINPGNKIVHVNGLQEFQNLTFDDANSEKIWFVLDDCFLPDVKSEFLFQAVQTIKANKHGVILTVQHCLDRGAELSLSSFFDQTIKLGGGSWQEPDISILHCAQPDADNVQQTQANAINLQHAEAALAN